MVRGLDDRFVGPDAVGAREDPHAAGRRVALNTQGWVLVRHDAHLPAGVVWRRPGLANGENLRRRLGLATGAEGAPFLVVDVHRGGRKVVRPGRPLGGDDHPAARDGVTAELWQATFTSLDLARVLPRTPCHNSRSPAAPAAARVAGSSLSLCPIKATLRRVRRSWRRGRDSVPRPGPTRSRPACRPAAASATARGRDRQRRRGRPWPPAPRWYRHRRRTRWRGRAAGLRG